MPSSSPASSPVSRWRLYCSNASSKRDTKTSHSIAVRRICCPPEQAANMADNSRATKGGQLTRYRHTGQAATSQAAWKQVGFGECRRSARPTLATQRRSHLHATSRGDPMVEVPITIACGNYDRTRAIKDGRVKVDGCAVTYLGLYPEEIFH